MVEGNGVPAWVHREFDRIQRERDEDRVRLKALEDLSVNERIWRGKVVFLGMLGFALFNGVITLAIVLMTRPKP